MDWLDEKKIPYQTKVVKLYDSKYENNPDYFLADFEIALQQNRWYPLPSLSAQEALLAFESSEKVQLEVTCSNSQW